MIIAEVHIPSRQRTSLFVGVVHVPLHNGSVLSSLCRKKLENVFVKHYAPNHMPDPKGEWSLKENNLELYYGNIQKLITSSTPWSVTICQISGSYPKQFFRYFVHKAVPIQNTCV